MDMDMDMDLEMEIDNDTNTDIDTDMDMEMDVDLPRQTSVYQKGYRIEKTCVVTIHRRRIAKPKKGGLN